MDVSRRLLRRQFVMHLSEINIYPIKSLKGISLNEAKVEDRGLQFDRRWMIVDEDWKFFTQREFPVMATIAVGVTSDGLRVTSGIEAEMKIPFEPDKGERGIATVWNSSVDVVAYIGAVSEWFSDAIGKKCMLVLMPEGSKRQVNADYAVRQGDVVSFADGYPFMLIGEGSLADLNSRLDVPVPMNRFRPNLVVAGSSAFEEDSWKRIQIGSTEFHVVKPCARCVITTVDQATGEKNGKEPLKTLSAYRNSNGNVLFGQNLIAETVGGTVRVGDEVGCSAVN